MKRLLLVLLLLLSPLAFAQGNAVFLTGSGAPSGSCAFIMGYIDYTNLKYYGCDNAGNWFAVGPTAAGATNLNSVSDPVSNKSFSMGTNTLVWNWTSNSSTANLFSVADFATNTGTGYLFTISSGASSATKPFRACYRGTSNCVTMDTTTFQAIGTAIIDANTLLTKTWASPAAIGTGTPAAGTFTTVTGNTSLTSPLWTAAESAVANGSGTTTWNIGVDSTTHLMVCKNSAGASCLASGGVTSVAMTVPTGFQLSGSPITSSGTLALSMPSSWTTGDLLLGNGANSVARLGIGSNGQCLTSNGTTAAWGSCAAGSIGGSGTSGTLPKFTASATIGDSLLTDNGTTLSYSGTGGFAAGGSNGGLDFTEGTGAGLTAATSHDILWGDSTAHRLKVNNNNGGATTLALFTDNLSVFAATTSAQFLGVISDEVGTGSKVAKFDSVSGNSGVAAQSSGSLTNGNLAAFDANGNIVDGGGTLASKANASEFNITTTGLTAGHAYYISAANTLTEAGGALSATVAAVCIATSTTNCARVGTFTTTGLTAGSIYYVPTTAAVVTATKPTSSGNYVQRVGVALSTTVLLIQPSLDVGSVQ